MANEILPFGLGAESNVMTQAEYEALAARSSGFSSGVAKSEQLNKVWRQSSFMASVLADFIAAQSGNDVLDNGNTATLLASLELAIKEYANSNLPVASTLQQGITKLSSLTNSSSETLAATLKAVKTVSDEGLKITGNLAEIKAAGPAAIAEAQSNLDLAALLGDALQKANNLSEIKDAGPAAVAQTLLNLGLGDAAKLGVATDAEVIAGLVDKAITAATLKSRFASVVLYPSGTEAVPPTLTAGQRIVIDNPFPGRPVTAEVEVYANSIWASPNIMVTPQGNSGPSAGAKANYIFESDKIIIQTAGNGVLYISPYSGSAHNFLSGGDVFSGTIFSARQYRLRVRTL
ncbi:TPA: tail fiber protein [Yersinia enterocolitica]|nr:tail fiber protein [Yersinia enterocolitica]